jgi:tRNA threonylcarbamoyl adenosine modification protein YjeE
VSIGFTIETRSVEETARLGAAVATLVAPGDIVLLMGELGSGKTTLTKAIVEQLGGAHVTSPTFTLCHRYDTSPPVAHVDCYRIDDGDELADLALEELLDDGCVAIVEWGDRIGTRFRTDALRCTLSQEQADDIDHRHVDIRADGSSWTQRLETLKTRVTEAVANTSRRR